MQINIKTSAANQAIVSYLTQKLPGGAKENIIARVALGSLWQQANGFSRMNLMYTILKVKSIKNIYCLTQPTEISMWH